MKKLLYLGIAVALTMGFGCALTDYALITSNNQSGPVNTNGKALVNAGQIATIWDDGSDDIVWYVDQAANGDRSITNYDFFVPTGGPSFFQDRKYCNPGWNGCSMVTASDPQVGDVDPFDYRYNANCNGARSLSLLLSSSRYYGECGRTIGRPSITDRASLLLSGKSSNLNGESGTLFNVGPQNTSIGVTNDNGATFQIPVNGHTQVWARIMSGTPKIAVYANNPVLATSWRAYGDFLARNATYNSTTFSITYAGVPVNFTVAGNRMGPISSPANVSAIANRF